MLTVSVLTIWFQSLFFWMMPTGINTSLFLLKSSAVSILVLLDDAYRLSQYICPSMVDTQVSILVLLDDAYRL